MQDFAVYVHDLRHLGPKDQDKCRKVCTTADGAFIETVPRVDLEAITPGEAQDAVAAKTACLILHAVPDSN